MLVLVCGSRTIPGIDHGLVYDRLALLPRGTRIMHGGARGVDRLAEKYAPIFGHSLEMHEADWEKHGKRAGILRNIEMLDRKPNLVIAFWDGQSRGTKHAIEEARRRGIPVEIHTIHSPDW